MIRSEKFILPPRQFIGSGKTPLPLESIRRTESALWHTRVEHLRTHHLHLLHPRRLYAYLTERVEAGIMNTTSECVDYDTVQWWDTWNVVSMVVLLTLDVLVIVGNILVIAAVYSSQKLRNVTNFFIVSLAVADLLVGVAVLPFSATWEVFKVNIHQYTRNNTI